MFDRVIRFLLNKNEKEMISHSLHRCQILGKHPRYPVPKGILHKYEHLLFQNVFQPEQVVKRTVCPQEHISLIRIQQQVPLIHKTRKLLYSGSDSQYSFYDENISPYGTINLMSPELWNKVDHTLCLTKLQEAIQMAVAYLDNSIDVAPFEGSNAYRRICLGYTGLHTYLQMNLGLSVLSDEYKQQLRHFSRLFGALSRLESTRLAMFRGSFPAWLCERIGVNFNMEYQDCVVLPDLTDEIRRHRGRRGLRNITVTGLFDTSNDVYKTLLPSKQLDMLSAESEGLCGVLHRNVYISNEEERKETIVSFEDERSYSKVLSVQFVTM